MSEKYSLSVNGSLGLNAGVAGYYSVAAIEINPGLWEIVRQVTDGDPLNRILGQIQVKDSNGLPSQNS